MSRSEAEIRADLEHAHTAALLAVRASVGDGPIGRLLRDVGPLLSGVEDLRAQVARLGKQAAADHRGFIESRRSIIAQRDAAIAERDGAQRECAELWDAIEKARAGLDDTLTDIRRRDQAEGWKHAAALVAAAAGQVPLVELQTRYLEVRQHTLSTAGLPYEDAVIDQAAYVADEAHELQSAAEDLANDGAVSDATGRTLTTDELLTATRHEIADVVLAVITLANILGVTVEACIAEKTAADRGRG